MLLRGKIAALLPQTTAVSGRERARAAISAFLGLLVTGMAGMFVAGGPLWMPALVAPMGASAVLLFAIPTSPLAQPWSILGGNLVAAVVGVSVAKLVGHPYLASALAVGIAIGLMMSLRCLHPPSGAIALTAVLGGDAIRGLGYDFVLWPVLGNSLLMVVAALVFNNLLGRAYPHRTRPAPAHATADPPPAARVGFERADLDAVLASDDEMLDIDRDELEDILRRTELRSLRRRSGHTDCGRVMSRDVIAIRPDQPVTEAFRRLREHHIKALPVTDVDARVVGIVTLTDLVSRASWTPERNSMGLGRRLAAALSGAPRPGGAVRDIMTAPVKTVRPDDWIADAILLFAQEGLHHLPVTDGDGRLVGILSQSDILVAMLAEG